jgi:hypothetical protein
MEKKFERMPGILTFSVIFLILITGCGKNESQDLEGPITGEEGLDIRFLENFPQSKFVLSSDTNEPISIILDVRNKGALDLGMDDNLATNDFLNKGKIFIGGFDDGIVNMDRADDTDDDVTIEDKAVDISTLILPARSSINPQGSLTSVQFDGNIIAANLQVEQYDPTILATICYPYKTVAGPNVCVDPDPFDDKQEKVCRLGSHSLSSQGAPIAVKTIDQEASSNKLRFKIVIENVGNGDVIKPDSMDKCGGTGDNRLKRDDFDLVELTQAKVGTIDLLSESGNSKCGPFATQNTKLIRLFDGEGFVICSVDKAEIPVSTAYTTPLNIELSYGYRSTASKSISIKKLKEI